MKKETASWVFGSILIGLAWWGLSAAFDRFFPSSVMVRRPPSVEPADIAQLRTALKLEKMESCALPTLASRSDWIRKAAPDSHFRLALPPDWSFVKTELVGWPIRDLPQATFANRAENRIVVTRHAYAPQSMHFRMDGDRVIDPESQCEATTERAGSFWSIYSGLPDASRRVRFHADAEAVTSGGKRYSIALFGRSPAERDTLVALASMAVLSER